MSRRNTASVLQLETLAERTRQVGRLLPLLPAHTRITAKKSTTEHPTWARPTQLALWLAHLPPCHLFSSVLGVTPFFRCGQRCLGLLHSQVITVGDHLLGWLTLSPRNSGLARAPHIDTSLLTSISNVSASSAAALLLPTLRKA